MNKSSTAQIEYIQDKRTFVCKGAWSITHLDGLMENFAQSSLPENEKLIIDGSAITDLDSAGALAIIQCKILLEERNKQAKFEQFNEQQSALIELVSEKQEILKYELPQSLAHNLIYNIGKSTVEKIHQINGVMVLVGDLSLRIIDAFGQWRRFHFSSIASNIDSAGIRALPIVGLLSLLIGVVLAYQMGLQLQTYGANIFIAYLSGMAIFREFAPLITAIIVAGRTSSAFTAQIGSMKINEEIDALRTMGLSPTELLVLPKFIGLLLIFPLLIVWADIFSLIGAMFMSKTMLGVGYFEFLGRLKSSVGIKQMMLGLYKAPVFAMIVVIVGCFQGFAVQSSADNIGSQTTKSVVQALFLIIVADAIFSIIYSWMGV